MPDSVSELLTHPVALGRAIRDDPVTGAGGWDRGLDIEGALRWVTADLDRLSLVVVEHAEFDHYGSGYSSYVEVCATKRDGSARRERTDGWVEVECLSVILCRLAPVACLLLPDVRSSGPKGAGAHGLPGVDRVTIAPGRRWENEGRQIKGVLDRHGITLVGPDPLTCSLPNDYFVETNLATSAQTIFDAWFHWID